MSAGAYGQDVSESITSVRVWDRRAGRARRLRAGDCVKLTLRPGTGPSTGETLRVRITSVRGATFRGKLVDSPDAPGLAGLTAGTPPVFTAAHIHSVVKGEPHPGPGKPRQGEWWGASVSTDAPAPAEAAKPAGNGIRPREKRGSVTIRATRGPAQTRTPSRRSSPMLSIASLAPVLQALFTTQADRLARRTGFARRRPLVRT